MSLDVYLTLDEPVVLRTEPSIYVREDGRTKQITRDEWDRRHPNRAPFTAAPEVTTREVYWANITHNLNKMADEAGIYTYLWQPEETGVTKAQELIEPLTNGLALLNSDPERFKALNPPNGWGDYDGLCGFVAEYLQACKNWPEATVRASR